MSGDEPLDGETPIDPSHLLRPDIGTRAQLNEAEFANVRKAVVKHLIDPPADEADLFSFGWMLAVHRDMFGEVWAWAGRLRTSDVNLGVPWGEVEHRLFDLSQRLPDWSVMPLMEQAARLHHEAVSIHPFPNGNGRWARLLADIWLRRHGRPPTDWAGVGRAEYLAAVRAADAGDIRPLVELHTRHTPLARDLADDAVQGGRVR